MSFTADMEHWPALGFVCLLPSLHLLPQVISQSLGRKFMAPLVVHWSMACPCCPGWGRTPFLWPFEDCPWILMRLQRLWLRPPELHLCWHLNPCRSLWGKAGVLGHRGRGTMEKRAGLVKCFLWEGSPIGGNPPHSSPSALNLWVPLWEKSTLLLFRCKRFRLSYTGLRGHSHISADQL